MMQQVSSSIAAGTRMLPKAKSKEAADEILALMQKSAARMSAMIDNVLDFARGRLGSGIALGSAALVSEITNVLFARGRIPRPATPPGDPLDPQLN